MSKKIICKINEGKIIVKFGEQGLRGAAGENADHALLQHLGYDEAGHIGFQKALVYIPEYRAYQIE